MLVKIHESPQAFLDEYEEIMLEREASSQLILYNAYKNRINPASVTCLFGAVVNEDTTELLFCNLSPYNLVIYVANREASIELNTIEEASRCLAEHIINHEIPITGINARYDVCQAFIGYCRDVVSYVFNERIPMNIMKVKELADLKLAKGTSRLAELSEVKLITDWIIQFEMDALTNELDYERALQKGTALIEDSKIYVFENEDNKVVSMAAATRELAHGMAISLVFTPEKHRGNGYAATNIYHMSRKILDDGYLFCTLFADKNNPVSNRAYEKVGYYIIDEQYEYKIIS